MPNIMFSVTGNGPTNGELQTVVEAQDFHLLAHGAGSFKLEFFMSNGAWQSSAESTFTSPCNKVVALPAGAVRLVIVSGNLHVECRS